MFFFRKKSKFDFSAVGIDMHSHLIPGIDDGAKNVEDSLAIIQGLKELGFHHLITTPHTLQDIHPNTSEKILEAYALLEGKIPEGISLKVSSEYFLDEQFLDQLQQDALLPLPGNKLLVEFSQIIRPHDLEENLFQIRLKGYELILAHPERYLFFHKQFDYYKRLKEMGVELQVNALSLTSHYGKHIQQIAEKLIKNELIDYVGTDIHHLRHLEVLKRVPESKYFQQLIESQLLKNHTFNRTSA